MTTQSSSFPGPISAAMLDELGHYVVCTPQPFVLDLARCEGMWLWTVDGQRLFDWCGYFGSKLIGHNHPRLYEPDYVKRLTLAANNKVANPDFLTAECLEYYRALHRTAPECMRNPNLEVYAVNSGAEAVENMMKYMVSRFNAKRIRQRRAPSARRFVYFDMAFHGRTVYALSVTQTLDPVATKDFHGLTAGGHIQLPFPAFDSDEPEALSRRRADAVLRMAEMTLSQMANDIVGIIVEPIQGAGGHRCAPKEFFVGLSELANKHDVYLAFDEVQTGLGATGRMFAIDHFDLPYPPIAVASGKKFANGVVYMHEPLEDVGVLDSTWGGSLADMVRFVQELRIVEEEGLVERAAANGERLASGLLALRMKHDGIMRNVRGMGLYQGFSLDTPERKAQLIEVARERYETLLLGAGRRTIRLRPCLSVTAEEVELFLDVLDKALTDCEVTNSA